MELSNHRNVQHGTFNQEIWIHGPRNHEIVIRKYDETMEQGIYETIEHRNHITIEP